MVFGEQEQNRIHNLEESDRWIKINCHKLRYSHIADSQPTGTAECARSLNRRINCSGDLGGDSTAGSNPDSDSESDHDGIHDPNRIDHD